MESEQEIIITRRQAVRGQLHTAIDLVAFQGDPISAHTLAAASSSLMHDLARAAGVTPFHDLFKDRIVPDRHKEWFAAVNRNSNFAKHADRDPEITESKLNPGATHFEIFEGLEDYAATYKEITFPMASFRCFMLLEHPTIFRSDFKMPISADLANMAAIAKSPVAALAFLLNAYKTGAVPQGTFANMEM